MLKVLEQLLHKIKANRRREMVDDTLREGGRPPVWGYDFAAAPNLECKIWGTCWARRQRAE